MLLKRCSPRLRSALVSGVFFSLTLATTVPVAGQAAKSSNEAKIKFSAAAELQNESLFDLAAGEWREFLEQYDTDPLAAKARHYLGVCLLQEKQYAEAAKELAILADGNAKFEMMDETLLNLGLARYSLAVASKKPADFAAAEAAYGRLIDGFAKSKWVPNALYYRGECLFAMEQLEDAVAAYSALLKSYPDHELKADAQYALGVAQLGLKQAAAAEQTFDTFLKNFPDHRLATRIQLHKADAQFDQEKYDSAEKIYGTVAAVEGFALADAASMRQADCLTSLKRYGAAADLFAAIVSKFPESSQVPAATLAAGNRYQFAENYEKAVDWLKKVKGDDAVEAAHWLARSYLKLKQPAKALAAVEGVLGKAKDSSFYVDLLLDQADAIYELPARRAEAVALYTAIADKHAKHEKAAPARYYAAWSASNLGQHETALQQAETFLKDHPQHELAASVKSIAADSRLYSASLAEAEAEYRGLIAKHPKHEDLGRWQRLLGWTLYRQKKYADAVALLDPILDSFKSPQSRAEVLFLIGGSQFVLKNYKQAADRLQAAYDAASQGPQADESLLLLSRAQRQLDNLKAAVATAGKLLKEFPQSELSDRAQYQLGNYHYAAEDYKAAAAAYGNVSENYPDSPVAADADYWLGWSHMSLNEHPQAIDAFGNVIKSHQDDDKYGPALYARAQARRLSGQFAEAAADANAFLATEPSQEDKSGALYERGLCEMELENYKAATATFQTIVKDDPQYASADLVKYQLGWSMKTEKQDAEAAEVFASLAADHPDSSHAAEAMYHVGENHYASKAYQKAATAYFDAQQKATKAGQNDVAERAAYKLAWSYYHQDDFQRALDGFAYQIKTFANGDLIADALFMKAECLFKQGKFAEALAAYAASRANPPASKDFQLLGLLQAGRAANQEKQWDDALALLEQCQTEFPNSAYKADILYEMGSARKSKGELDQALPLFEQAAGLTQAEVGARARLMMGEIKFEQGKHKEAIRDFFKVFRGYSGAPESYDRWKAQATYEAARCFQELKSVSSAKKYYQEVLDNYPDSQVAGLAKQAMAALK